MHHSEKDKIAIDEITARFFELFTNRDSCIPNVKGIKAFFIPNGILINNTGGQAAIYDLESFIKPREIILSDGTLENFCEKEISSKTEIHTNIAHRISQYEKSGVLHNNYFKSKGQKMIQFIKLEEHWMMASVVWRDEI